MSVDHGRGLKCSAEWHLWRSGLALAIYDKIGELTYNKISGTYEMYSTSVERLSQFFGSHYQPTWRAVKLLTEKGFLVRLPSSKEQAEWEESGEATQAGTRRTKRDRFKSKNYRYVPHKDWAEQHPEHCLVREATTWDGEAGDRLGVELYKASASTTWYENQLVCCRRTGLTDEEIVNAFKAVVSEKQPHSKQDWKRTQREFVKSMADRQANVETHSVG